MNKGSRMEEAGVWTWFRVHFPDLISPMCRA